MKDQLLPPPFSLSPLNPTFNERHICCQIKHSNIVLLKFFILVLLLRSVVVIVLVVLLLVASVVVIVVLVAAMRAMHNALGALLVTFKNASSPLSLLSSQLPAEAAISSPSAVPFKHLLIVE